MARLPSSREREPRDAETSIPTEVELKLALDAAAVPALLRHPALRPLRRGRTRTAHVVSTYFDSPDFRLERATTSRCAFAASAGAGSRRSRDRRRPAPAPACTRAPSTNGRCGVRMSTSPRLAATPWKKLVAKAAKNGGLVACCTTEFERRTIPLEFPDGTTAELCVDLGEIRAACDGRTRREPIAEVEIELKSGDAANLFRLALALSADLPLAVMTDTKAARGYALRARVAARRARAGARRTTSRSSRR